MNVIVRTAAIHPSIAQSSDSKALDAQWFRYQFLSILYQRFLNIQFSLISEPDRLGFLENRIS